MRVNTIYKVSTSSWTNKKKMYSHVVSYGLVIFEFQGQVRPLRVFERETKIKFDFLVVRLKLAITSPFPAPGKSSVL